METNQGEGRMHGMDTETQRQRGDGSAGTANTPSFGDPVGGPRPGDRSMESTGHRGGESSMEGERGALEKGREIAAERMEGMRNRVEEQIDEGMRTTADRMEGIAQRIDDVADSRLSGSGLKARAGDFAHSAADRLESTAGYLKEQDAHSLISRIEDQVRERPLEMMLAGVATGWLLGKLIR